MLRSTTLFVLTAALALAVTGCGDDGHDMHHAEVNCDTEDRADTYVAGLEKTSTQIKVSLVSDPAPPSKGDNVWTLTITDLNDNALDGLTINATPFMPDHGHGTPNQEDQTDGASAGEYVLSPVNLWMPGLWEVTIDVTGTDIDDSVVFSPCIDG